MPQYGPGITLNDPAFVHPSAQFYGHVTVQPGASIWPNAVARAENFEIVIGEMSNVQDFVMIHVGVSGGTRIGKHCSITHRCTVHGCTIGDNSLIGINATIMDGCVIGENCIIAGHTYLKENTVIPDNSVVMGIPGRVTRNRNNFVLNRYNAFLYHQNGLAYAAGNHRRWDEPEFDAAAAAEMAKLRQSFAAMTAASD